MMGELKKKVDDRKEPNIKNIKLVVVVDIEIM